MRLIFEPRGPISLAVDALSGVVRLQRPEPGQPGLLRVRRRGGGVLMRLEGRTAIDCSDFSADLLVRTVHALRASRCIAQMQLLGAVANAETVAFDILESHLQDVLRQRWGLSPAQALLVVHGATDPVAHDHLEPDGGRTHEH